MKNDKDFARHMAKVATAQPTSEFEFKAKDTKEYEEMLMDFVKKQFEDM